jgi:hypothetical protein
VKWKRLAIQGYRSIAAADLRLGEITTVIGESDTGKSNLVRALRDWAFNAKGEAMISAGSTVARVAVVLEDGHVVAWEHRNDAYGKGGAGSAYYVRHKADTTEFRRIGGDVPPEVSELTAVRELEVDEKEFIRVQFAEQSDPWFLLASQIWTPGKVTKVVGKTAGLDSLILANRALERERIDAGRRERAHRLMASDHRRALGEYVGLDRARELAEQAAAALDRAKALRRRIEEARAVAARMRARKETAAAAREEVALLHPVVARAADLHLSELVERRERARWHAHDLQQRSEALEVLRGERDAAQEELREAQAALKKLAKDGDLRCPACGGPLHAECRRTLAAEAARA